MTPLVNLISMKAGSHVGASVGILVFEGCHVGIYRCWGGGMRGDPQKRPPKGPCPEGSRNAPVYIGGQKRKRAKGNNLFREGEKAYTPEKSGLRRGPACQTSSICPCTVVCALLWSLTPIPVMASIRWGCHLSGRLFALAVDPSTGVWR